MELFIKEYQHEPRAMLADVIKLYALHYNLSERDAAKQLRLDSEEILRFPLFKVSS